MTYLSLIKNKMSHCTMKNFKKLDRKMKQYDTIIYNAIIQYKQEYCYWHQGREFESTK